MPQEDGLEATPHRPLQRSNESDLQAWFERLPNADLETQFACLRKVQEAGPAGASALPALCAFLARSDGATDDALLAAVLDVFRSMGQGAVPAAETLSGLLPHRCKIYQGRDKMLVVRLRSYIVVTLSEIGFPSSALPSLLDSLAHLDERMMPVEIGAAARAVGSLGPRGRRLAPHLLAILAERLSDEEFSLERFGPEFPPQEATTVQQEALRALGRICSPKDRQVLECLQQMVADRDRDGLDPRVVREAEKALGVIQQQNTPKSVQGEGT